VCSAALLQSRFNWRAEIVEGRTQSPNVFDSMNAMRILAIVSVAVFVAACSPSTSTNTDSGSPERDSGPMDAGHDAGPLDAGADASVDAGSDAGPVCECSGVSACCDGCVFAPTSTVCSSSDGPALCAPATYVVPGFYGYDETVTHCGSTGACDGVATVVPHRWACPSGYYCRKSGAQAICDHP
jgi:hypothetical protein